MLLAQPLTAAVLAQPILAKAALAQATLAQAADPTGLSTPLGKAVIAAGLIAVIVVLVRVLRDQRNR